MKYYQCIIIIKTVLLLVILGVAPIHKHLNVYYNLKGTRQIDILTCGERK